MKTSESAAPAGNEAFVVDWESADIGALNCALAVKRILAKMADEGELTEDQALAFAARLRAAMPGVRHLAEREGERGDGENSAAGR